MNQTILVVDDDEPVCRASARMLIARGYRVLQATTPRAALDYAADPELAIDLLLTDVRMPEINGPELASRLVALRPSTAVMFMSAYSRDVLRDDERHADAPFIVKPFSPEALGRSVADTLERHTGLESWQQPDVFGTDGDGIRR